MDRITIKKLTLEATIGVERWEQAITQKIILDLNIYTDITKSASSDDLNDTIDYATITQQLQKFVSLNKFKLLEKLASDLANLILQHNLVTNVKLSVYKKALANAELVGVTIER